MMPDMRQAVRAAGGRRVTCLVIRQKVEDHEAVQEGRELLRASIVLTPMHPREIAIKPEGQREWKWWTATSSVKLELGWFLVPDRDKRIQYEVMTNADWGQARVQIYEFVESPRGGTK